MRLMHGKDALAEAFRDFVMVLLVRRGRTRSGNGSSIASKYFVEDGNDDILALQLWLPSETWQENSIPTFRKHSNGSLKQDCIQLR